MTNGEISVAIGLVSFGCGGIAFGVRHVLKHFHATTVAPSLAQLSTDMRSNTRAADDNTAAITAERESRQEAHRDTRDAIHSIRDVLANHETRITVTETEVAAIQRKPKPAVKRTANRRAK